MDYIALNFASNTSLYSTLMTLSLYDTQISADNTFSISVSISKKSIIPVNPRQKILGA